MARLADEVIERIKREVSLVRLIESQGYKLAKHGKDFSLSCPFHNDKTASLVVTPSENLFHCFGCGTAGSVIDWVIKTQGISFRFACELLLKDLGLVTESVNPTVKRKTSTKLDAPLAADADSQTALSQVIDYYHETLKQAPEALEYLRSRGLENPELVERFKLGFANRTLGYRLPDKTRKAGAELRGKLQEIGIYRKTGHEHLNGSLVVPILNTQDEITEVYGRKILGSQLRKGTAQHLYLPGPHVGVWNCEGLVGQEEVILCEALIDAMTFWVNGYRNVTSSYGTSGFTACHLAAFKLHNIKRVLIAYDRDEAGNTAAENLAKKLSSEGFDCFRINFPKGMDANQYALEVTPASKSLGIVIRSAEWMGQGKAPDRSCASMHSRHTVHPEHKRQLQIEQVVSESRATVAKCDETLGGNSQPEPFRYVGINGDAGAPESQSEAPAILAPAAAVPPTPSNTVDYEVRGKDEIVGNDFAQTKAARQGEVQDGLHEIIFTFGERKYRVRGLEKNKNYEVLKINLLASCGDNIHVDSFDFYAAKQRQQFIKLAALELEQEENTVKKDLGKVLLKLEELQEKQIKGELEPQETAPVMTEQEQSEALELLQNPSLLSRILEDFERAGVVGEETNKLVGYLAASSRKLDRPLAIIVQSTSAAGKSALMDAVLAMMPEDERMQYSAMTGQSLFYMGETNLKHKILAISEEEGASNASYALKLLQSEGEVTIASTGKDEASGDLVTKDYKVEGPVMLFLTTTAIDIDEELLNRCLVLTVNESREQTRAIHEAQRKRRTLEGLQAKLEKERLITLHRNAQKLLRPLAVINPFADKLTFLNDKTRTRRDHEKYLTLIDSIALLHQYQREIKVVTHNGSNLEYIEVQLSDIETANKLAHEVLGRTLDELPAQTRKLLKLIQQMVNTECKSQQIEQSELRFSRRDVREYTGWGNTQLKVHLRRLEEMEYLLTHRGMRGQSYDYELLFAGDDSNEPQLMGLIETENLHYDKKKAVVIEKKSALSRPQVGERSDTVKSLQPNTDKALLESGSENVKSTSRAENKIPPNRNRSAVAVL